MLTCFKKPQSPHLSLKTGLPPNVAPGKHFGDGSTRWNGQEGGDLDTFTTTDWDPACATITRRSRVPRNGQIKVLSCTAISGITRYNRASFLYKTTVISAAGPLHQSGGRVKCTVARNKTHILPVNRHQSNLTVTRDTKPHALKLPRVKRSNVECAHGAYALTRATRCGPRSLCYSSERFSEVSLSNPPLPPPTKLPIPTPTHPPTQRSRPRLPPLPHAPCQASPPAPPHSPFPTRPSRSAECPEGGAPPVGRRMLPGGQPRGERPGPAKRTHRAGPPELGPCRVQPRPLPAVVGVGLRIRVELRG